MAQSSKRLQMDVTREDAFTVVRVSGSADITDAERMREELEALVSDEVPLIVLDLSEMDFICSAGLAAIISAHLRGRHHRGQIHMVNPQPSVRELLEVTCLIRLFPIYESIEQAVAS